MDDWQAHWESRWEERAGETGRPADPWLQRVLPLLPPPGRALDIACGQGRNALCLAAHGYAVTAVDFSAAALDRLRADAAGQGLAIATVQLDLEGEQPLPAGPFELIIDFFFLHRPLLPRLFPLLRPGGVLVLRTFSRAGSFPGGPDQPAFVLAPGELPRRPPRLTVGPVTTWVKRPHRGIMQQTFPPLAGPGGESRRGGQLPAEPTGRGHRTGNRGSFSSGHKGRARSATLGCRWVAVASALHK